MKMNIYKLKVYDLNTWTVRVKNLYGVYYAIIINVSYKLILMFEWKLIYHVVMMLQISTSAWWTLVSTEVAVLTAQAPSPVSVPRAGWVHSVISVMLLIVLCRNDRRFTSRQESNSNIR